MSLRSFPPTFPELLDRAWAAITAEVMRRTGLSARGLEHEGVRWVAVCHGDNHVHVVVTLARQDRGRARVSMERVRVGSPPMAAAPSARPRAPAWTNRTTSGSRWTGEEVAPLVGEAIGAPVAIGCAIPDAFAATNARGRRA
jgi:hypothetical protein